MKALLRHFRHTASDDRSVLRPIGSTSARVLAPQSISLTIGGAAGLFLLGIGCGALVTLHAPVTPPPVTTASSAKGAELFAFAGQPTTPAAPQNDNPTAGISLSADTNTPPDNTEHHTPPSFAPITNDVPVLKPVRNAAGAVQMSTTAVMDRDQILNQAQTALTNHDTSAALALYNRVLATDADDHAALSGKAFALTRLGDYRASIEVEHHVLQTYPNDDDARRNLIAALGASFDSKALDELQRMSIDNVNDARVDAALAQQFAHQDNYAEAINRLNQAVRLQPGNLAYRLDLAALYDRAGYSAEALGLYQDVLRVASAQETTSPVSIPTETILRRVAYLETQSANFAR